MQTDRFTLSPIIDTDIENIYRGLSNPLVTRYYDVHFPTLEATKEQMEWYRNLVERGTGAWWTISAKAKNTFVGACGFNGLDKTHRKAEVGLWLLPEFWGIGILKEVMPLVFDIGFNTLDINRIEGFVDGQNSKCKAALEKIHFTHEGTMRECEFKNGAWLDVDIYAILKSEWQNKRM